jgi:cytochrome c biogenesis protein CcdA
MIAHGKRNFEFFKVRLILVLLFLLVFKIMVILLSFVMNIFHVLNLKGFAYLGQWVLGVLHLLDNFDENLLNICRHFFYGSDFRQIVWIIFKFKPFLNFCLLSAETIECILQIIDLNIVGIFKDCL